MHQFPDAIDSYENLFMHGAAHLDFMTGRTPNYEAPQTACGDSSFTHWGMEPLMHALCHGNHA
eukprot:515200-Amphidinium_carterae.1